MEQNAYCFEVDFYQTIELQILQKMLLLLYSRAQRLNLVPPKVSCEVRANSYVVTFISSSWWGGEIFTVEV